MPTVAPPTVIQWVASKAQNANPHSTFAALPTRASAALQPPPQNQLIFFSPVIRRLASLIFAGVRGQQAPVTLGSPPLAGVRGRSAPVLWLSWKGGKRGRFAAGRGDNLQNGCPFLRGTSGCLSVYLWGILVGTYQLKADQVRLSPKVYF